MGKKEVFIGYDWDTIYGSSICRRAVRLRLLGFLISSASDGGNGGGTIRDMTGEKSWRRNDKGEYELRNERCLSRIVCAECSSQLDWNVFGSEAESKCCGIRYEVELR